MAERSILAYFRSPEEARCIVPKLQALRGTGISVDRIGRSEESGVGMPTNTLDGEFPGLSFLSLGFLTTDVDARVLLAADTDASGMSDRGDGILSESESNPARLDTLLTVSVNEEVYEQALRVIREAGGRL